MERFIELNRELFTTTSESQFLIRTRALLELILELPIKLYNTLFTPMGRKALWYFLRKTQANLSQCYRKDGTLVYSLGQRQRFVLHRGNRLSELVFLEKAYEPLETLIVSKVVRRDDVVLDLGANVGYFTALLDKLVKPGGEVHSFEPGQGTFARLEETKALLKLEQTILHQKAVGESVGHIDFWLSTCGWDAQQNTVKNRALGKQTRHSVVEVTTLDAFVEELQPEASQGVAFVKCDIEGAEPKMLRGAQHLLNSEDPPIWLIEHNREALSEHGATSEDLLSPFGNFDVYFVSMCWPPSIMASPQASKWSGVPADLPDECNLIILPRQGAYSKRTAALQQAGLIP